MGGANMAVRPLSIDRAQATAVARERVDAYERNFPPCIPAFPWNTFRSSRIQCKNQSVVVGWRSRQNNSTSAHKQRFAKTSSGGRSERHGALSLDCCFCMHAVRTFLCVALLWCIRIFLPTPAGRLALHHSFNVSNELIQRVLTLAIDLLVLSRFPLCFQCRTPIALGGTLRRTGRSPLVHLALLVAPLHFDAHALQQALNVTTVALLLALPTAAAAHKSRASKRMSLSTTDGRSSTPRSARCA